ncbi:MAG: hypothetical protein JWO58_109 [Chitinophagaceae bacterium]|nr:hypothetical protein [Chitinophagaceae bacterium]
MKKLLEIFFIVLLLLLANAFLFLFWWILTDPSNYIWEPVSTEREQQVLNACSKIFWTKYYTWTLVINLLTLSFLFYIQNRVVSLSLCALALIVYAASWFFFDPYTARSYVTLFETQEVSPAFLTEPIKQGGQLTGEILVERIADINYPRRYYAIKALGEIRYAPAAERLGKILLNGKETRRIRGAAYLSLKSIRSSLSAKYLLLYSQLVLRNEKERKIMQQFEKENGY